MADREGFEPSIQLPVCRISSAVLSTAQPPVQRLPADRALIARAGAVSSRRHCFGVIASAIDVNGTKTSAIVAVPKLMEAIDMASFHAAGKLALSSPSDVFGRRMNMSRCSHSQLLTRARVAGTALKGSGPIAMGNSLQLQMQHFSDCQREILVLRLHKF